MDRRTLIGGLAGSVVLGACRAGAQGAQAATGVRPDLYPCEGCDAARERPAAVLPASMRIAGASEPGERFVFEGVVYALDGRPAPNVVVYAYHTNAAGLYANGSSESEWSRRHGRLRGWVKTGADGRYRFESIKPAPYPERTLPAHIHMTVLEPGRPTYWIDSIVFADEFGVDAKYRATHDNRGGSGIVALRRAGGVQIAVRDIRLERHPA